MFAHQATLLKHIDFHPSHTNYSVRVFELGSHKENHIRVCVELSKKIH